jgi:hypothetical protein
VKKPCRRLVKTFDHSMMAAAASLLKPWQAASTFF